METLTNETFVKRSSKIHKNKYLYHDDYKNAHTNIKITCPDHGVFYQRANAHIRGHGCPKCAYDLAHNSFSLGKDTFIKKAKKVHGNKYDYSLVEYIESHKKVKIICPIHGEFLQKPNGHLRGKGCFKCYGFPRSTTEKFIDKSRNIHGNKYNYSLVNYIDCKTKVMIVCPKHGKFKQTPNSHLRKSGCSKCWFEKLMTLTSSNKEKEFLSYLNISKNFWHFKIDSYFVDGFCIKTNTVYEFLGDYWHGNPEVFNHKKINECCKETFGKLHERTFSRFTNLKNKGYIIKYIWENDWNKYKKGSNEIPKIQCWN